MFSMNRADAMMSGISRDDVIALPYHPACG
jgi:hypothetical protein